MTVSFSYFELDCDGRELHSAAKSVQATTLREALRKIADEVTGEAVGLRLTSSHSKLQTWVEKVRAEEKRLNRTLHLDELLGMAKNHEMTAEEREAQRQSWTRQIMD